jgi:hypothetical protein
MKRRRPSAHPLDKIAREDRRGEIGKCDLMPPRRRHDGDMRRAGRLGKKPLRHRVPEIGEGGADGCRRRLLVDKGRDLGGRNTDQVAGRFGELQNVVPADPDLRTPGRARAYGKNVDGRELRLRRRPPAVAAYNEVPEIPAASRMAARRRFPRCVITYSAVELRALPRCRLRASRRSCR